MLDLILFRKCKLTLVIDKRHVALQGNCLLCSKKSSPQSNLTSPYIFVNGNE